MERKSNILSKKKEESLLHVLKKSNSPNPYSARSPKKLSTKASKKNSSRKLSDGIKEKDHLISHQIEEIYKLKLQKAKLQAYILELETRFKNNQSSTPCSFKSRDKPSRPSRICYKKSLKKIEKSFSLNTSPLHSVESLGPDGISVNAYRETKSQVLTQRNSTPQLQHATLHDILIKTEQILQNWKSMYCFHKLSIK